MKGTSSPQTDRIRNVQDLLHIRKAMEEKMASRISVSSRAGTEAELKQLKAKGRFDIMLCLGTSCISSGALKVRDALIEEIGKHELQNTVRIVETECHSGISLIETGCNGFCAAGPVMVIYPGGYFYNKIEPDDVSDLISEHILNDNPVERLMYRHPMTDEPIPFYRDIPFFAEQALKVLRNKGIIAAERIEEYIGREGYAGFARALTEITPQEIIDEVKNSGLRGRGGAGFSTGLKWDFCRKAAGDRKYILCNADEGDPGAFMDRSLIESDPHAVLEGMMIAGRAIGAATGYIYCRAEYPLALQRLNCAIADCRKRGLLGEKILGTDFSFDIFISQGSGAFVCGEETALIRSIEGNRGEPRPRPPFPANKGLWGKPSLLNNVETFGSVSLILREGAERFKSVGTQKSPGTKIFALTGKVRNIGLIEVPMGTCLGELIYDIGGGIPNDKDFKAAQIGGPSGGCIPKRHLNVPLDYESLDQLGAIMGSGGLVVMDENTCMVDIARFFLEFVQEESCGKCAPCRLGTRRMLDLLDKICEGKGELSDLDELEFLGTQIKKTTLCGLGQTAPNPVLSTIRHFRDEYIEHIVAKQCKAGVCPELVRAPCQSACPAHVDIPGYISLTSEKRYDAALRLHRNRNPLASVCARVCVHFCENPCRRATIDESVSIRGIKRFMVEQEQTVQMPEIRENAENAQRKIAIIGAGPAGLSCAYFLARLGYKPQVFEAEARPGGMLVQTIPPYRLPREELHKEIQMIVNAGVTIETGRKLGRNFTLASLKDDGYDAVFLGVGAPNGVVVRVNGFDTGGVTDAISFLREYNLNGSVTVGKRVVVVGGGNSAIDAARTAIRLGAEVTVVYRRTRGEMPAYRDEIEAALEEGVVLKTLTNPTEILSSNGNMSVVKCHIMKLGEFDRSGRRAPLPSDETFTLDADQLIFAVGQTLDCPQLLADAQVATLRERQIKADPFSGQTSVPWIFAGGDAATGPASVIEAVAGGERAAVGIDEYLSGENHAFWREDKRLDTAFDPDADPISDPRIQIPHLPVTSRKMSFDEVELPWSESAAMTQCKRCLRCDYGK